MNATSELSAAPQPQLEFPAVEMGTASAQSGRATVLMDSVNTILFCAILGVGVLIPVVGGIYAVVNY